MSHLEQIVLVKGGLCCICGDSTRRLGVHVADYLVDKVNIYLIYF